MYSDRQFHPGIVSLKELFAQFDVDDTAKISASELSKALQQYNVPCSEAQTLVWMKAMDLDNDGELNFEEFSAFMRYAWDVISKEVAPAASDDVIFLGGSCNPTTWRTDISVPLLQKNNVHFFNPQVDDWTPDLMVQEQNAKKNAEVLLFVVDGVTRSIASMVEIAELISIGRKLVLVINNVPEGQEVEGSVVTGREVKDLNRGRAYLADVADRHNVPVYSDVIHATIHAIKIVQGKEIDTMLMARHRTSSN